MEMLRDKGWSDHHEHDRCCNDTLSAASAEGHRDIVQILLDKGMDVDTVLMDWGSAINRAAYNGHQDTVVSMVGVVWCDPLHHTTLECMVWCSVVPLVPLVPHGAL
jgi:hypothetical protein